MDFATYLKEHQWDLNEYIIKFDLVHLMHTIQNKTVKMAMSKLEKLVIMAKYLKEYPIVNQKAFEEMLNDVSLKKYKKIADLYVGTDLVEQLRANGGVHVARLIENQKKASKEIQKWHLKNI